MAPGARRQAVGPPSRAVFEKRGDVMRCYTMLAAAGLGVMLAAAADAFGPALPSPAERAIQKAQAAVDADPSRPRGHAELAFALARRARETAAPDYYERAHAAVDRALALSPDDVEARKARAWVLLGQHRFGEARDLALELNKRVPDDVVVYGLLADAHAELGDYAAAEAACNWMLRLRPGNVPALTRAAYLRELFGDVEGALELMAMALDSTPFAESEDRAWILTQIGHLETGRGRATEAERALAQALEAFPDYHYALGRLARLRRQQGRHAEEAALLERRQALAEHPENRYELAEALQRAGRRARAAAEFARFEREARAEMAGPDNANRELIFYYADHARRPAEALRLAEAELAQRRDVFTRDAYAWALRAAGRRAEARAQIEGVLAVGTRDPRVLEHARALGVRF
jgi:tetratricopeptide (TPR) repeat protein